MTIDRGRTMRKFSTLAKKQAGITARERAAKRGRLKSTEMREKLKVRNRDKVCRFPRCGCHTDQSMKAVTEVSHDFHKGMGGDPEGVVSIAPLMVLVCKWRHQDAPVSFHAKTLRTRYLTPDHNDGPIAWEIDRHALYPTLHGKDEWCEVARETYGPDGEFVGYLEPLSRYQEGLLNDLAEMER